MKEVVRSYFIEAKWLTNEEHKPAFGEYLRNAFVTSAYHLLATISCYGLKSANEQVFDWLMQNPKILEAGVTLSRLMDDLATFDVIMEYLIYILYSIICMCRSMCPVYQRIN